MGNKVTKYAGIVVENGGKYYLKNTQGVLYFVKQTENLRELCLSRSVCVFEVYDEVKAPTYTNFATITKVIDKTVDQIPEGQAIAEMYGLIRTPNAKVMSEVANIPQVVTKDMQKGITDLTSLPFITIDPDSAKDYDDAVYACKNNDGTYTLRVAIANVAKLIDKNSELFKWAMEGGNSSYLGAVCNPMLPEELSNGICSLNEGVNRLVMCTSCTLDDHGKLLDYTIEPAVIRSKHRLTYKEADFLHFGKNAKGDTLDHSAVKSKAKDVLGELSNLYEVSEILHRARMKRGAFDIDSKKLSFKFNDTLTDVVGYEFDHSEEFTSVIEETAVLANEIWGETAEKIGLGFYYRNHSSMDASKINELRNQLKPFGIKLPKPATSKALQQIINSVKGKRIEEHVVSLILKTMQPAYYDTENIGHTGLAIIPRNFKSNKNEANIQKDNRSTVINNARTNYFKETGRHNGLKFEGDITHSAYAHSTSPIRRGADTANQMQMLHFIETGEPLFKRKELQKHADNLNFCERNASRAEAIYDDMLAAKWAMKNLGKVFKDCTITDIDQNNATVVAKDGFRMLLPLSSLGAQRRYIKIGTALESVVIDKVTLYPAKITCLSGKSSQITKDQEDKIM